MDRGRTRREAQALHRLRGTLTGVSIDPELEALFRRYAAGDLTMPDVLAKLKRRRVREKKAE
jgi:hypothetical protein